MLATPSEAIGRTVGHIEQLNGERTCSIEKDRTMAPSTTFRSPYDHRVQLVRDTIRSHSELDDKEAGELAEHVLQALNSIPEKMR